MHRGVFVPLCVSFEKSLVSVRLQLFKGNQKFRSPPLIIFTENQIKEETKLIKHGSFELDKNAHLPTYKVVSVFFFFLLLRCHKFLEKVQRSKPHLQDARLLPSDTTET